MFKVMLVDDEIIVRRGIRTSIDWAGHGIEIAAEAMNGKDALAKLAEHQVDLVLTDIRMPVMTGIELSHEIKRLYPEIEIVLLSGYEDFQYAKEAMGIGIQHYLLKPVMAEKLVELLTQIRDKRTETQSLKQKEYMKSKIFNENLPTIKSEIMKSLLSKKTGEQEIFDKAKTLKIGLSGPAYQIFIIDIDDFSLFTEMLPRKEKEAYMYGVLNIAEETLLSYLPGFLSYGELDRMIGLVNIEPEETIVPICEEIQANIQKYLKLSVTIGIGKPRTHLLDIDKSYAEAINAIQHKAFEGKGKIIPFREPDASSDYHLIFFTEEEKRLIQSLKAMNGDGICEAIDHYFLRFSSENYSFKEIKGLCVRLIISLIQTIEEMGIKTENLFGTHFIPHVEVEKYDVLKDLEDWIKNKTDAIITLLNEDKNRNSKKMVKEAIQYIAAHYEQQITLTDIADRVFVTPAHFSKVFKEEMGVTFIKWLNQYRVEEAKKLLKTTWDKTYEIAEKVGYQDYKYFSIIFKKYTGYSPRDYRNQ
jgi:two-component system response regulator YesN